MHPKAKRRFMFVSPTQVGEDPFEVEAFGQLSQVVLANSPPDSCPPYRRNPHDRFRDFSQSSWISWNIWLKRRSGKLGKQDMMRESGETVIGPTFRQVVIRERRPRLR